MPSHCRLFIALPIPSSIAKAIAHWQNQQQLPQAKPVAPDKLHLTLAFLGVVSPEQEAFVTQKMDAISALPWRQELHEAGYFSKPQIGYLSPTVPAKPLVTLNRAIWQQLSPMGFGRHYEEFKPHVSVFRQLTHPPQHLTPLPALSWEVDRFALYESTQGLYQIRNQWIF